MNYDNLTDSEINKMVHERILKKCWHEWKVPVSQFSACVGCEATQGQAPRNPDYCTSLDAVAVAEAKVIEKKGTGILENALEVVIGPENYTAFASARTRAIACLAATEPVTATEG